MAALEFPRNRLGVLTELAVRLLSGRKPKTDYAVLARDLLAGFREICTRYGLDILDVDTDNTAQVADKLSATELDGGGPRNAKPQMVVDSLLSALGLTVIDASPEIALDDTVRLEILAAITKVMEPALALPQLRDAIIEHARKRCEERYFQAFNVVSALLDERGLRLIKTPKVPVDALHAVQRGFADARHAILERAAGTAVDRAKELLARADAEAAERIDRPVTHKLTARDVAIHRACDPRVPMGNVAGTLLDGLTDVIPIAWRAADKIARPYSASQTFAVGDVLEHPKFGRGSVVSCLNGRIEVEFADTKVKLISAK